jgi:hypothetical protein
MFQHKFKIQINPETRHAHIGFRISENYVQNYVISLDAAAKLFNPKTDELTIACGSGTWWYKKLKNHHKLFFKTVDRDEHFRFSYEDWINLRAMFAAALVKNNLA